VREQRFREYCAKRGFSPEQTEVQVSAVRDFEAFLAARGDLKAGVEVLKGYLTELIDKGLNSEERLLALARYGFATDNNTLFIYMVGVLSGREVVSNLSTRAAKVAGRAARDAVFADLALPPLGSPQEGYVEVTRRLVEGLRARLPVDTCRDVLAGNNHGIPRRTFSRLRRIYRKSGLDAVLRFPAVVDHVRRNPEIQSGVRVGQSIFVSKIPYAPVAYLGETDPKLRRYHMCHCPLARASILGDGPTVPPLWCYCSGGYEKLAFDVIFQRPVRVKVLESALAGDPGCRFEIEIPEGEVK